LAIKKAQLKKREIVMWGRYVKEEKNKGNRTQQTTNQTEEGGLIKQINGGKIG
jgi:hypothetical protein